MLDKNAIEVAGFVQSTKNYARTFMPTLTADEYAVLQLKHGGTFNDQSALRLISALVEDMEDVEALDQITQLVEQRKAQLP